MPSSVKKASLSKYAAYGFPIKLKSVPPLAVPCVRPNITVPVFIALVKEISPAACLFTT
jgi:hypothetical protein